MRKCFTWMMAPVLLAAGVVSAQDRNDPARTGEQRTNRATAGAQTSRSDEEIAAVKLAFCRNEVELAKLASQKAKSEDVRQFAAQMVKEHTDGCTKLEKRAGNLATAASQVGERRQSTPRTGAEVRVQPGARPGVDVAVGGESQSPLNWVAVQQQMASECLNATKQELAKKEGAEFDKCFIGMAIAGHHQTVIADRVFQNYASSEFRGDLEECEKTASTHLDEAKRIMEKLSGK